jgi:hypothetical protein
VGNITPNQRAPYVERLSLALLLPRYLLIGQIILMGGFGMVIMGVLGLMHTASLPYNPFAVYADVFPGQPISGLEAHRFYCWQRAYNAYQAPPETHCNLSPTTGVFARVEIIYTSDLIHQLSFILRDTTVNVGDLAGFMGISKFDPYGSVLFTWQGKVGVAQTINQSKHFSMFRPVWQVTLTDTLLSRP